MTNSNLEQAHADIDLIFRITLPSAGREPREGQIKLAHTMLDTLMMNKIAACDAGVGIGKTDAYIIASIVSRKHSPELFMNETSMPVAIATSSISLQHAIVDDYIPFLSETLMESGYISHPLTAQIRKGKQNYLCNARRARYTKTIDMEQVSSALRATLHHLTTEHDLDLIPTLTSRDRMKLCVPESCERDCPYASDCAYNKQCNLEEPSFFQVCNHHYLLADAIHKHENRRPLLPNYRGLIIDEAHLFHDAVQSILGKRLSMHDVQSLQKALRRIKQHGLAQKLGDTMIALFDALQECMAVSPIFKSTPTVASMIRHTLNALMQIEHLIADKQKHKTIIKKLKEVALVVERFSTRKGYTCLLETDEDEHIVLQTIEKTYHARLAVLLYRSKGGLIFTSGTLSTSDNMEFFKKQLGLSNRRVVEMQIQSPFDYERNSILYIATGMPHCNSNGFLPTAAMRIAALINATAGHTLILCTSHRETRELMRLLAAMCIPYPLFAAYSRTSVKINEFRDSTNGVLLCTAWEGIDFPGDIVASVIIPRLPFPRRDALHEGQKVNFKEMHDYVQAVAVPEMLLKLRQGTGRGMRLIADTCAISILDCRAEERFCAQIREALPPYPVTYDIADVEAFVRRVKPQKYFNQSKGEIAHA